MNAFSRFAKEQPDPDLHVEAISLGQGRYSQVRQVNFLNLSLRLNFLFLEFCGDVALN